MPAVRVPSLRRHKPSGQAVVTLGGHDHYLGPWPPDQRKPPPEIQARYDALVAEWLAGGRRLDQPAGPVSIAEVIEAFWRHAEQHYLGADGRPTNEQTEYRMALRPLRHLYGQLPAEEFSPLKLKAVRQLMVTGYEHPKYGDQQALARGVVNQRVGRIVRAFKWAVAEELVPDAIHSALGKVKGLQKGRTSARETEPVKPVASAVVEATLPFLLPVVQTMVRVQLLTGMRPGEVCVMRACDLDASGPVWLYRPKSHKTAHRDKDRVIAVGPQAQAVLRPWLRPELTAFLFSPAEAVEAQRAARRSARTTPLSCGNRPGTNRVKSPKRFPGVRYSTRTYYHAILRAARKADKAERGKAIKAGMDRGEAAARVFVPEWHPHQLRHTHATDVRRRYGLEAAQVALGHASANVTQLYAERDLGLAVKVASEIG